MILKFKPTIPLKFYYAVSGYDLEKGGSFKEWHLAKENFADMEIDTFFCEWVNSHGKNQADLYIEGVENSATIRMNYIPSIYQILSEKKVVIAKNGTDILKDDVPDESNNDAWELMGGIDNMFEANQVMEFMVKRFEMK